MRADELAPPEGDIFKFTAVGDTIEGTIVYVGDWENKDTKFGPAKMMRLGIETPDNQVAYIWPIFGAGEVKAIAKAMRDAGIPALEAGQYLKLRFNEEIDTGKGSPFKAFVARVTPPTPQQQQARQEAVEERRRIEEKPF